MKIFSFIAPIFTYLISLLIPGRKASVAASECRNKCRIMVLVNNLESYIDDNTRIEDVVDKCYELGTFPALWAVEGVGKDLAEWHLGKNPNPSGIMMNCLQDTKYDKAQTMMNAGIGIGFARLTILGLPENPSDADVLKAVDRMVTLCRNNAKPGFYGAAAESIGLASRFMKDAAFCRQVDKALRQCAPDTVGYFWRGVGRCLYFHPSNFLPGGTSRPSRGVGLILKEAPSPDLIDTMLSGLAWATTVVNMVDPHVMEYALENFELYECNRPGWFAGVCNSTIMRFDTTPDDPTLREFMNFSPADPRIRDLWKEKVKRTMQNGIEKYHPVLARTGHLEEVFHYVPLADLVKKLEAQ